MEVPPTSLINGQPDVEEPFEELEEVIEENKHYDKKKQRSLVHTFDQMTTRLVIIFAGYLPMHGATQEQYVNYLFSFVMIALIAYVLTSWLESRSKKMFVILGHYAYEIIVDFCMFIFDFFTCAVMGLIKSRGNFGVEDIPYVVFILILLKLFVVVWNRHIQYKRFVSGPQTRETSHKENKEKRK